MSRLTASLRRGAEALAARALFAVVVSRGSLPQALRALDACAGLVGTRRGTRHVANGTLGGLPFWKTTCLWRALAGYAVARAAGEPVEFVIGVRTSGGELQAHAWLQRDGQPDLGAPAAGEGYAVAFTHPPRPASHAPRDSRADAMALRARESVVLTELADGTGVLLDLDKKTYFTLNESGVRTWKLLAGDRGAESVEELAVGVARSYDVAPDLVRADVGALIEALESEGLIQAA